MLLQVLRQDDWAVRVQPQKVDFVKMHVDGYEIDVIEAGRSLPTFFSRRAFKELLDARFGSRGDHVVRTVSGKTLTLEPSLEAADPLE